MVYRSWTREKRAFLNLIPDLFFQSFFFFCLILSTGKFIQIDLSRQICRLGRERPSSLCTKTAVAMPKSATLRRGRLFSSVRRQPFPMMAGSALFLSTATQLTTEFNNRLPGDSVIAALHSGRSFQRGSVWLSVGPPVKITTRPDAWRFGTSVPTN